MRSLALCAEPFQCLERLSAGGDPPDHDMPLERRFGGLGGRFYQAAASVDELRIRLVTTTPVVARSLHRVGALLEERVRDAFAIANQLDDLFVQLTDPMGLALASLVRELDTSRKHFLFPLAGVRKIFRCGHFGVHVAS